MISKYHTAYLDGCLELEQNGLADKDFAALGAQILDFVFGQLYLLTRPAAPH